MGSKKQLKLERWIKHEERSLSNKWYSIGRIDLLIISISSGGLYVLFETFKFVTEEKLAFDLLLLRWGSVFFTVAIIINFASQIFGFYANKLEAIYATKEIKKRTGEDIEKDAFTKLDSKITFFNYALNISNIISVVSMLGGIVLLARFYWLF